MFRNDLFGQIYLVFFGDLLQYSFMSMFSLTKLEMWLSSPLREGKQGVQGDFYD